MLAVSMDSNGWTVVTPSSDTRKIYVSSSSGKDSNSGLSSSSPVKSIGKAYGLLRAGKADWLLLKRGDKFPSLGDWRKGGKSSTEPMLISAYGSGSRPQIQSGTGYGIITYGGNGRRIDNLYIQSLSFTPHTYNHYNGNINTGGIRLLCQGSNILIEDCKIQGYRENITIGAADATVTNVKVRRNEIVDAHAASTVGNAQGLYVSAKVNGITIEENVIDHNGWRHGYESDRTFFNHNVYVYNGARNVVIRNNLITRAGFYGIKLNAGGTVTNNFFARNSESIYLEGSATISDNVITEAVKMPTKPWAVGINTQKAPSATIRNNLVTQIAASSNTGAAGILLYNGGTFTGAVEKNVIYNWRNGMKISTPGKGTGSVKIMNNKIISISGTAAAEHWSTASKSTFVYQNNTYYDGDTSNVNKYKGGLVSLDRWKSNTGESTAAYRKSSFADPGRTIGGYNKSKGGSSTFDAFISTARNMDRVTGWKTAMLPPAVNNWFRAGFGMGTTVASTASVSIGLGTALFSTMAFSDVDLDKLL